MNDTLSLEQIFRTGKLVANIILQQNKLGLTARFMEIKAINLKKKQKEITKELEYSTSTLHRHRARATFWWNF